MAEVINLAELKGYRSEIATRRQHLVAQRHDLQTNLDNIGHALEHVEALMGYCARVRQQLQTFDPTEKRQAFEALNVRITRTPRQPLAIEGTIPLGEIVPLPLVLQGHLNHPEMDRGELRELRKFLRQPLVGASVQQLRKAIRGYSSTNDVRALIETVRALYQHQGALSSLNSPDEKPASKITREDLKLVCYEYISA